MLTALTLSAPGSLVGTLGVDTSSRYETSVSKANSSPNASNSEKNNYKLHEFLNKSIAKYLQTCFQFVVIDLRSAITPAESFLYFISLF